MRRRWPPHGSGISARTACERCRKDHGLLLFGQAQPRQSLDVRRQPHLRVVRTDQHLVDPDVAQGPDELVPDRRVGGEQQGAGNIEIEVVEGEPVRGARQRQDVPEAEIQATDVREDEGRARHPGREIEQLLVVARQDVGVVRQHDDAEFPRLAHQRFHARIVHVETLGVRVDLQHLHPGGREPRELVQRRLTVMGMDRGDRQHQWIARRQCDHAVVAGTDRIRVAGTRLVGTAEPHGANARQLDPGCPHLVLVRTQRRFPLPQMHMHIEDRFVREGRERGEGQGQGDTRSSAAATAATTSAMTC
jgi:hypothetical protein